MHFFALVGRQAIELLNTLGAYGVFSGKIITGILAGTWSRKDLFEQLERIGVKSILVVSITSAFTGMVMAVQTLDQFIRFGASSYIGGVIALSLVREMSPVLTG
ncbi:MAG TPA: sulfate transporter, partial [Synergistaceae bacterium]|nr:sulfate transporter [Synergistaceae bacterium]